MWWSKKKKDPEKLRLAVFLQVGTRKGFGGKRGTTRSVRQWRMRLVVFALVLVALGAWGVWSELLSG